MRELGPDRLSKDGRSLILREPGSAEAFCVPVDARLAALVDAAPRARDRSGGQMEITMESTLSPRDIQARIRRGESIDQVAEAAGVPHERIEGFAAPVVAERAYMAEQARATTIRRRHAAGAGVLLGEAVDESLAARGQVATDALWDAWRREDGRWTVRALTPGGEEATFSFDAKSRYVLPDDEAARSLVGDVASPESTDMAIADALVSEVLAESGIPDATEASLELRSLDDAEPGARDETTDSVGDDSSVEEQVVHASVRSLKEARDRRAMEQLSLTEVDDDSDEADEDPGSGFGGDDSVDEIDDVDDSADLAVPDTHAPQNRKKRPERRRVPSWDEIMFGGRPQD